MMAKTWLDDHQGRLRVNQRLSLSREQQEASILRAERTRWKTSGDG